MDFAGALLGARHRALNDERDVGRLVDLRSYDWDARFQRCTLWRTRIVGWSRLRTEILPWIRGAYGSAVCRAVSRGRISWMLSSLCGSI